MKTKTRSVLLKTSSNNDVQHSGGTLSITGLADGIRYNDILDFKQIKQRAEVVRVSTVTVVAATAPTVNTTYTISIKDPNRRSEGYTGYSRRYAFTTPPVLTTMGATAALQNEYITLRLVAAINEDSSNFVSATSLLLGTGFTITDDAGYYPARLNGGSGGRKGTSSIVAVTNADGTGYVQSQIADTTSAVYSFGNGARMLQDMPVLHAYSGNIISGEYDTPVAVDGTFAVSGQLYDAFYVNSLCTQSAHAVTDQIAHAFQTDIVFVDNGTGASTTNRAGFLTFQRAMLREIWSLYTNNVKGIWSTFDDGVTYATLTGLSVIPVTALAENTIALGNGETLSFTPSVAATTAAVAAPRLDATNGGLNIAIDAANLAGTEISAQLNTFSNREYTVGKDVFSIYARIYVDDVSGVNPLIVGFRKKAAYAAAVASYTDYVGIGLVGGAGVVKTQSIVGSVASTPVSSTVTWADTETHELEIRVNLAGVASYFIDGKPTTPPATLNTLTAGTIVIPFVSQIQTADVAAAISIREIASLPTTSWRA